MSEARFIQKVWGQEEILISTPLYAAKILHVDEGGMSSIHLHNEKTESFRCMSGQVLMLTWQNYEDEPNDRACHILLPDDVLHMPVNTAHKFIGLRGGGKLLEVSTEDKAEDNVRFTKSQKVSIKEWECVYPG